jgi:hypothetical protein
MNRTECYPISINTFGNAMVKTVQEISEGRPRPAHQKGMIAIRLCKL